MDISDDTKTFLRAVLGTSAGMPQSRVLTEYNQTTGERLNYSKYGYTTLYHFLIALEGDVTRLEFSPNHGENLVYSVLDKTKYASQHAIKYAQKVRTGMKSKSPEEILLWKKDKKVETKPRPVQKNNNAKKSNSKRVQRQREVVPTVSTVTTVSEWAALRKLLPGSEGVFTLSVRSIGINKKGKFEARALYLQFLPYNVIEGSIKYSTVDSKSVSFISFPSYFTAYRAWKEKDKTIIMGNRIGIEPAGGNLNALSHDIHMVLVSKIPTGISMSSFVTLFAKYAGLICIDSRPRENCAIISYSTLDSANRACSEIKNVTVNKSEHAVSVQILDERPSMFFGAVNSSLLKSAENKCESIVCKAESTLLEPTSTNIVKPADVSSDSQPTIIETNTNMDADLRNLRACGFCVNYEQYCQMFHITCRKKPSTMDIISDEIQILVTHQIDPIRFWGWLLCDSHESVMKLTKIEESIASAVARIQPPHVLPKEGHRGAALYKEDKESWYRCYVLSSNDKADEIEVFYCDYGNSEIISRTFFRSTYNDVWSLPPQAIPFKMYGFELKDQNIKSTERFNLEDHQVLKATVVKSSLYSQPHIIEIKHVRYASLNKSTIDENIIGTWCISTENGKIEGNKEEVCEDSLNNENKTFDVHSKVSDCIEEKLTTPIPNAIISEIEETVKSSNQENKIVMESLFDYDDEDLVLGLLAEAHNPNLLYLKLGDVSQFALLQIALDKAALTYPTNLDKGITLMLNESSHRRRVLTLQLLPGFGKAKVLQVDYGIISWVAVTDLYHLDRDLQDAPFQARPASLAGIDCQEKMDEAIDYLKSKTKIIIKTNVIHEFSSGKISVELFDLNSGKSVNKEMIEEGLASHITNEFGDTDEELSADMIHRPVKELNQHIPQTGLLPLPEPVPSTTSIAAEIDIILNALQLAQPVQDIATSVVSWNSQSNNPFQSDNDQCNVLTSYPNVPKSMDVSNWLQTSPVKNGNSNELEAYSDGGYNMGSGDPHENEIPVMDDIKEQRATLVHGCNNEKMVDKDLNEYGTPNNFKNDISCSSFDINNAAYPQPDIVASNKISTIELDQGFCIDGRQIKIGDDNEILNVGKDNRLHIEEVNEIRQKWALEKSSLIKTKAKLEHLMGIPIQDLMNYYIFMKKEKLQLKLRIRQSEKYANKLDSEYQSIIQETHHILSLV